MNKYYEQKYLHMNYSCITKTDSIMMGMALNMTVLTWQQTHKVVYIRSR
jgi:hypothetical protein